MVISRLCSGSEFEALKADVRAWLIANIAKENRRELDTWENLEYYWKVSTRETYPSSVNISFGDNDSWALIEITDVGISTKGGGAGRFVWSYEIFVVLEWSPAVLQLKLAYF